MKLKLTVTILLMCLFSNLRAQSTSQCPDTLNLKINDIRVDEEVLSEVEDSVARQVKHSLIYARGLQELNVELEKEALPNENEGTCGYVQKGEYKYEVTAKIFTQSSQRPHHFTLSIRPLAGIHLHFLVQYTSMNPLAFGDHLAAIHTHYYSDPDDLLTKYLFIGLGKIQPK